MRAFIQRVSEARVKVAGEIIGEIDAGFLVLVCAMNGDDKNDIQWMTKKLLSLRVMADDKGKLNLSIKEKGKQILLVSQFTLSASLRKGNRPSFTRALLPESAALMIQELAAELRSFVKVAEGRFGADMKIELINDGPISIWLDSQDKQ